MATNITAITDGTATIRANAKPKTFASEWTYYTGTCTLTDATLPAQSASICDVTITGAALGDFVLVSYPADLGGIILTGRVKAANTVEIMAFNVEGTDAVTTLSGGLVAKIVVMSPNFTF
jgi:hypothetical protein